MEIQERFEELREQLAPLKEAKDQLAAIEAKLSECLDHAQRFEDRKNELIRSIAELREKSLAVAKTMVADLSDQPSRPAVVSLKKKVE